MGPRALSLTSVWQRPVGVSDGLSIIVILTYPSFAGDCLRLPPPLSNGSPVSRAPPSILGGFAIRSPQSGTNTPEEEISC